MNFIQKKPIENDTDKKREIFKGYSGAQMCEEVFNK